MKRRNEEKKRNDKQEELWRFGKVYRDQRANNIYVIETSFNFSSREGRERERERESNATESGRDIN